MLAAAIGKLLDLDIAYWAEVNLGGFVNLVNSVGGVTVNVTKAFCDPNYKEYGVTGFGVSPGRYHMNGDQALAYARIRKAAGESDFTRAARQQEVIAALRDRLVQGAFLGDPARFLRSLGRTIRTNVQPGVLADDIDLVSSIPRSDVFRVVIQHPLVRSGYDARGSIQVPDIPAIRDLAARLFTPTGVRPVGFATMPSAGSGATRNASSSTTCGITPTPRPRQPRLHRRPRRPRPARPRHRRRADTNVAGRHAVAHRLTVAHPDDRRGNALAHRLAHRLARRLTVAQSVTRSVVQSVTLRRIVNRPRRSSERFLKAMSARSRAAAWSTTGAG